MTLGDLDLLEDEGQVAGRDREALTRRSDGRPGGVRTPAPEADGDHDRRHDRHRDHDYQPGDRPQPHPAVRHFLASRRDAGSRDSEHAETALPDWAEGHLSGRHSHFWQSRFRPRIVRISLWSCAALAGLFSLARTRAGGPAKSAL